LRSPQKFTEASKQREKLITLINKMAWVCLRLSGIKFERIGLWKHVSYIY
jgi:hypothetical protein